MFRSLYDILLTYLLTPWCRVLLEKLTGLQLVKKFPAFYGTRRFITALTNVRHLSLSWASPIQSTYPHPTSWRSILILSTHLRLGLPSGLFPSGFPTKTLYALLSSPIRATWPAHFILKILVPQTLLSQHTSILPSHLYPDLSIGLVAFLHKTILQLYYVFFWLVPQRLNYICRRFGTLYLFHLHRPMKTEQIECSETSAYIIQTPGNYPKKT